MRKILVMALGLAVSPAYAGAQWSLSPDGHNQYAFDYSTSMRIRCAFTWSSCIEIDNGLVILSETGSLTFRFSGTSGVFTATNVGRQLDLGTLQTIEEGSFAFPTNGSAYGLFLVFNLSVNSTSPMVMSPGWNAGYIRFTGIVDGSHIVAAGNEYGFRDHFRIPTAPPPPRGSTILLASHGMLPRIDVGTADHALSATVGLVPESSTWMMLGTGLLALGGVAVTRRSPPNG